MWVHNVTYTTLILSVIHTIRVIFISLVGPNRNKLNKVVKQNTYYLLKSSAAFDICMRFIIIFKNWFSTRNFHLRIWILIKYVRDILAILFNICRLNEICFKMKSSKIEMLLFIYMSNFKFHCDEVLIMLLVTAIIEQCK